MNPGEKRLVPRLSIIVEYLGPAENDMHDVMIHRKDGETRKFTISSGDLELYEKGAIPVL